MNKGVFVGLVSTSVVVLDQLSKWLVRRELPLHDGVPVFPGFFSIVHAANRGGAFSLFAEAHEAIRLPFFFAAAVVAVGFLIYFVRQIPSDQRLLLFALAAVLGGALGNLIDRAVFGQVTDFLLVYYRGWTWPAFNVADSFITIGVTILVAHSIFGREADQPHAA
ncbi:MAG TPA: signal peptidase II [Candidatus Dormibacteraeota bacterium]|nr:signal peptidase II [Candidatus Dormibacteraeota bacterium]